MHYNKLVSLFTFLTTIQSSLGRSIPFDDDLHSLLEAREPSELSVSFDNVLSPLLEGRMLKRPAPEPSSSGSESGSPPRTRPPPGGNTSPSPEEQPVASTPGASGSGANAPPASGQEPAAQAAPAPQPPSRSNTMPPPVGQPGASTPGASGSGANAPPAPQPPSRSNTMPLPGGQPGASTPGASGSGANAPPASNQQPVGHPAASTPGGPTPGANAQPQNPGAAAANPPQNEHPWPNGLTMTKDHGGTAAANPGGTQFSHTVKTPFSGANNNLLRGIATNGVNQVKDATQTGPRPGNVAAVRMGDQIQVASSQKGIGGPVNLHPALQGVINNLDNQGAFKGSNYPVPGVNGAHSEIHAINNQLHQNGGVLPTSGNSVAVNVKSGEEVSACKSCSPVLKQLGINHKAPTRRSIGALQLRIAEALADEDLDHYVPRNLYAERLYSPLYIRSRL